MKRRFVNFIFYIILICLFILLFISVKNIYYWFKDNKKTNEMESIIEDGESGLINVDLNDLKNINSDTVGYIKVNNTNINYPVVQTTNNTFYLNHTFLIHLYCKLHIINQLIESNLIFFHLLHKQIMN